LANYFYLEIAIAFYIENTSPRSVSVPYNIVRSFSECVYVYFENKKYSWRLFKTFQFQQRTCLSGRNCTIIIIYTIIRGKGKKSSYLLSKSKVFCTVGLAKKFQSYFLQRKYLLSRKIPPIDLHNVTDYYFYFHNRDWFNTRLYIIYVIRYIELKVSNIINNQVKVIKQLYNIITSRSIE